MRKKLLLTMLLLLSIVAPFAAIADSFTVKSTDLTVGTTETLQFNLENSQAAYGFQAEVKLPVGITAVKGEDGQYITLTDRANDGAYSVNSNILNGNLIMGAFSGDHKPLAGNSGALVNLNVKVADDFKGGDIEILNVSLIDSQDKDVALSSSSANLGVAVSAVTFVRKSLTLQVEKTTTLVPTVTPSWATNQTLTWTSSDAAVASVDDKGLVTAIKVGSADITATSSNGKSATCTVNVETNVIEVTSIILDATELNLTAGDTKKLVATVSPENATDKSVVWSSDNEKVATVDEEGNVTAIAKGTAIITAEAHGFTATCQVTVANKTVAVTGVTLNKTTLSLTEGETGTLTATVAPSDATDKTVTWTSSDEKIATVKNGIVTAIAPGTATITVTASGKTATCEVTVNAKTIAVSGITLDKTTLSLIEGESGTLTATVAPDNATDKSVTWTSSDAKVASVDDKGIITAVAPGSAIITATASGMTATCTVTVTANTVAVTGVTLDKTSLSLTEGETATLTATVAPADASNKTVTWTSSDAKVASVDDKGLVTALAAGKTTITATASGKTATCEVTVTAKTVDVTGVTLNKTILSLIESETETLTATVAPSNATDKSVTWSSDNESVATVNNGVVTAVAPGTATITATASGKTATCKVTVVADDRTTVPVKMTYVNMDEPTKAYGEIAEGETALAGFNKISGNTVGFGNTSWGANYITYLQVNVSEIKGTIMNATLSFEASGSTDSKRTTGWGVGYNSSVWSSDMTYDSADKSITTIDAEKWTTTKSAATFESFSFDITEAVLNAENGLATILVYETAAAGGYIKNPVVKVKWTEAETYGVTFKETNGAEATVIVNKLDVSNGTSLPDGTYTFYASAKGYKDYEGEFTVAGAPLEVAFTMTPKDEWKWTLKNNVNDETITGTCLEGESATAAYHRYILADNGTVWMKAPCGGDKKLEYNYTFTPDANNYVETLEYSEYAADGIYFIEAENMAGMTASTKNNAEIRCSNAEGAYPAEEGAVEVTKLLRGTYKVEIAFMGGRQGDTDPTFFVKAGEKTILNGTTNGSWTNPVSEEFTLDEETVLTVEGGSASKPLDYVLVTGEVNTNVPVTGLAIWDEDDQPLDKDHSLALITGDEYTLTEVVTPENATEQKVTWTSSDESVAKIVDIVEEPHQVHIDAIAAGEATVSATLGDFTCSFKVTVTDPVIPVTGITLDKKNADMLTGATLQLNATITPEDASSKEIKWTSSDNNIATVSTKGLVTAKKAGKVTITATSNKFTATCEITITDPVVDVEGITLDKTALSMTEGDTETLTATVAPDNATDKSMTWTSSNEAVAAVDGVGNVTAVAPGEAVITAKAGEKTATCVVTVAAKYIPVEGLVIRDEDDQPLDKDHSLALITGDEYTLTEVVSPENATDQKVTWTSSDEAVAKIVDIVEEPHQVHIDAIGAGEATVTATLGDFTCSFKVTVTDPVIPVTGITLDRKNADMLTGATLQLNATITPEDASSKEIKWTSSDNNIATVSTKGLVTAKKAGKVTITATANKFTATCEITITDPYIEVTEITLDQTEATIYEGETLQLVATVTPEDATDPTVTWTSSDEFVATVDENGLVTALSYGEAIITAQAGDKTAECTVKVDKYSAVGLIGFDSNAPVKVFDLNGIYISDSVEGLTKGTYIVLQGNNAKKISIR
ncbi:MAG: Ig-like domain-containing protein [Muribaculaceae bacterium]|nr:Ig-like domain-containing protein [Muribaculaceae bacterium]